MILHALVSNLAEAKNPPDHDVIQGIAGTTAALIAAGLGLGGQIYSGIQSRKNVQDTIQARKKQANLAYEREQEQIKEMKKYNSPSQQMQRFEDAGLNPNLIYSQGTPGQQQHYAQYQPPTIDYTGRKPYIQDAPGIFQDSMASYQTAQSQQQQKIALDVSKELRANNMLTERHINETINIAKRNRKLNWETASEKKRVKVLGETAQKLIQEQDNLQAVTERTLTEKELAELKKTTEKLEQAYMKTKNDFADRGLSTESSDMVNSFGRILYQLGNFAIDFFK